MIDEEKIYIDLVSDMKLQVQNVLEGKQEYFYSKLLPPNEIVEYLQDDFEFGDFDLDKNGWQYDYCIRLNHEKYGQAVINGSGFNGGFVFDINKEEIEEDE